MKTSPWLVDARLEAALFVGSGLAATTLAWPLYLLAGPRIVGPLFVAHVVLLSLPHHYLTWASIAPRSVRLGLRLDLVALAVVCALAVTIGSVFGGTGLLGRAAGTAIGLLSVWHIYRQHYGIAKVYDAVQRARTGDPTLTRDRAALDTFLALGSFAMVCWLFTHEHLAWGSGAEAAGAMTFEPVYTPLPAWTFHAYVAITFASALVAVYRCVIARLRAGRLVPVPQLAIAATAVLANNALFAVVPPRDTLLVVTVASSYHIVQYVGFVWIFERHRTLDLEGVLPIPQRLARSGSFARYFGLALLYSAACAACALLEPVVLGLFVITFSNVSHYLVDGIVWKREFNESIGPTVRRIADSLGPTTAHGEVRHPAPRPLRVHGL